MSSVEEVQKFSLSVLLDIVKHAGPFIRPFLVQIVVLLLESLSELESPQLNYVSARITDSSHQVSCKYFEWRV